MAGAHNNNAATKWILPGTKVTGSHVRLVLNPNPNIHQQVREKVFGYVVEAIGHNQYIVLFDNEPTSKICLSGTLKIVAGGIAVPVKEEVAVRAVDGPEEPPADNSMLEDSSEEEHLSISDDQIVTTEEVTGEEEEEDTGESGREEVSTLGTCLPALS